MAQNQNETFDLVDEQDRVIGQETRGRVHALNLRHRAIHVFLFNTNGDVLLQRRSPAKDRFPDCWDSSCSGHVDSGETYDAAAWRELSEELGLMAPREQVEDWTLLGKIEARAETGQEFVQVYAGRCAGPFTPCTAEISEVRWFNLQSLNSLVVDARPSVADALAFLITHGWVRPPQSSY